MRVLSVLAHRACKIDHTINNGRCSVNARSVRAPAPHLQEESERKGRLSRGGLLIMGRLLQPIAFLLRSGRVRLRRLQ